MENRTTGGVASRRPVVRRGDHVLTPTGRLAVVEAVALDGYLTLSYESGMPGRLQLDPRLVRLVSSAEAAKLTFRA